MSTASPNDGRRLRIALALALPVLALFSAGMWFWRDDDDARRDRFLKTLGDTAEKYRPEITGKSRQRQFETSRTLKLCDGKLQAELALSVSTPDGFFKLRPAAADTAPQKAPAVFDFDVQAPAEGKHHRYKIVVTVRSLTVAVQPDRPWRVVEGRWLGEVEDVEDAENVFKCSLPCRATTGGACELHLTSVPADGGAMQTAALLHLNFVP